jgi:hypothetical protein
MLSDATISHINVVLCYVQYLFFIIVVLEYIFFIAVVGSDECFIQVFQAISQQQVKDYVPFSWVSLIQVRCQFCILLYCTHIYTALVCFDIIIIKVGLSPVS